MLGFKKQVLPLQLLTTIEWEKEGGKDFQTQKAITSLDQCLDTCTRNDAHPIGISCMAQIA